MRAPQVRCVDRAQVITDRRSQRTVVDQLGDALEQFVLGDQVRRLIHRAREHEFPVQGNGFALERYSIERACMDYEALYEHLAWGDPVEDRSALRRSAR